MTISGTAKISPRAADGETIRALLLGGDSRAARNKAANSAAAALTQLRGRDSRAAAHLEATLAGLTYAVACMAAAHQAPRDWRLTPTALLATFGEAFDSSTGEGE